MARQKMVCRRREPSIRSPPIVESGIAVADSFAGDRLFTARERALLCLKACPVCHGPALAPLSLSPVGCHAVRLLLRQAFWASLLLVTASALLRRCSAKSAGYAQIADGRQIAHTKETFRDSCPIQTASGTLHSGKSLTIKRTSSGFSVLCTSMRTTMAWRKGCSIEPQESRDI